MFEFIFFMHTRVIRYAEACFNLSPCRLAGTMFQENWEFL